MKTYLTSPSLSKDPNADSAIDLDVKIDTGYHRAGVNSESGELKAIVEKYLTALEPSKCAKLRGLYSHAGHSYGESSQLGAMTLLRQEIEGLQIAGDFVNKILQDHGQKHSSFVFSIGATPSASSIQAVPDEALRSGPVNEQLTELKAMVGRIHQQQHHQIELHAGGE